MNPVETKNQQSSTQASILVVDDDCFVRGSVKEMVEELGYEVATATSGMEAIQAFGEREFSTVLMDCFMPVVDGISATREIRNLESTTEHRVRIVGMSGADRMREALAAGMNLFVEKPFSFEELSFVLNVPLTNVSMPTGTRQ